MESIRLLRVIIEIVVKDVSVKRRMKRSDGDKNKNEDENEKKRVMVEKSTFISESCTQKLDFSITKNTSENLGNSA